nr:MAG TPA: hypothetical protein [Caudoviricetes sp.]
MRFRNTLYCIIREIEKRVREGRSVSEACRDRLLYY